MTTTKAISDVISIFCADGQLDATPAQRPQRSEFVGRAVSIAPLDPVAHADSLFAGAGGEQNESLWRYLFEGPFVVREAFDAHLRQKAISEDPLFYAILDKNSGDAMGYAAYMRIEPTHRVIEVGSILFTPRLQRTVGSTEAMYLMAQHVFEDLGYRRYEWKCNAQNEPSRRAAERLGFTFEGIFRQHMIVKGRNRDTAWFSMLDSEWPQRKAAFERWLDPSNFDANGRQKISLSELNSANLMRARGKA
jgi:RimJ/RimL family protein N-acetyltransferase